MILSRYYKVKTVISVLILIFIVAKIIIFSSSKFMIKQNNINKNKSKKIGVQTGQLECCLYIRNNITSILSCY